MSDLVRTLILCGILSGTQPVTVMGLLLVMAGGTDSRRKGLAYLAGAFLVESGILLFSSLVLGGTVSNVSVPGRLFLIIRMAIGLALIVVGCCERSFAQFGCRQFDPAGPAVRGLLL